MEPRIQYAKASDGVNIAYYAIGDGPPLVHLPWVGLFGNVEREWQFPEQRAWSEHPGRNRRLIRLDFRGAGLSDRGQDLTVSLGALDVEAVVRKEGLKRFALLGQINSAAVAMLYACQHPEMVSHLVLWSPFASYRDFAASSAALQAARAAATKDWGTFTDLLAQHATGWSDLDQARRFAAYLRECLTVDQYVRAVESNKDFDITPRLGD